MEYIRICHTCGSEKDTVERMLDTAAIKCGGCGGEMFRKPLAVSFNCAKADSSSDRTTILKDTSGRDVVVKTEADAKAFGDHNGCYVSVGGKDVHQDIARNRKDKQKEIEKSIHQTNVEIGTAVARAAGTL
jgi:DNA-directed RNA polymerase subunit RPC12/RpoP